MNIKKLAFIVFFVFSFSGCEMLSYKKEFKEKNTFSLNKKGGQYVHLITTGYCSCEKCTGWRRNWKRQPVFKKGRNRGKIKKVGITADGTKAQRGIIAADIGAYPFGTEMYIPGYGWGEVHDTGTAIDSKFHIDLFFPTHREALEWGRQTVTINVWKKTEEIK